MSDVEYVNPPGLPAAIGFSHAARLAPGGLVVVAGQVAHDGDGEIRAATMADQFGIAVTNFAAALAEAGATVADLAWIQIFVTDMDAYRRNLKEIGEHYRRAIGRTYPPMALLGVQELFDERAMIEMMGFAHHS